MIEMFSNKEWLLFGLFILYFLATVFSLYAIYNWLWVIYITIKEKRRNKARKKHVKQVCKQVKREKLNYNYSQFVALAENSTNESNEVTK